MSKKKVKRDYQDRDQIDISQKDEVEYWAHKFKISEGNLLAIIERVGPLVKDVRETILLLDMP